MRNIIVGIALAATTLGAPAAASTTVTFHTHEWYDQVHVEQWLVPFTTQYTITAIGGSGGDALASDNYTLRYGGRGAGLVGTFDLSAGTRLDIIVGGAGFGYTSVESLFGSARGGGGGGFSSVVYRPYANSSQELLLVAAGGGGAGGGSPPSMYGNGGDGRLVESGYSFGQGTVHDGGGGDAGIGYLAFDPIFHVFDPRSSRGGGGGGSGWGGDGGSGYAYGGGGGHYYTGGDGSAFGGLHGGGGGVGGGGGGGAYGEGGGGGGFSGGAGGDRIQYNCNIFGANCSYGGRPGGGGGSFNGGIFKYGVAGYGLGDGAVYVTFDAPVVINPGGGGHNGGPPLPLPGAVPEPASWAMLIMGFGLVGAAQRRSMQCRVGAVAAASTLKSMEYQS